MKLFIPVFLMFVCWSSAVAMAEDQAVCLAESAGCDVAATTSDDNLSLLQKANSAVGLAPLVPGHGPVILVKGLGNVKGNIDGSGVESFLGITYANVRERFGPPMMLEQWPGETSTKGRPGLSPRSAMAWSRSGASPMPTYDATKVGQACHQFAGTLEAECPGASGVSEDCLNLNIWRPKTAHCKGALPVYFWIHGGSARSGCGARYNGKEYADKYCMIVVSANYRLGPLGWTASEELRNETASGANGGSNLVLDTMEAVKWVRKYISSFGGDPDQITIGGESAGAHIICAYLYSPLTKDLGIARFELQSTGCNGPWAYGPVESGLESTEACQTALGTSSISGLRKKEPQEFLKCASTGNPAVDGYVLVENPQRVPPLPFPPDLAGKGVVLGVNDRDGTPLTPFFAGQVTNSTNISDADVVNLWYLESSEQLSDPREALTKLLRSAKISNTYFGEAAMEIVALYSGLALPSNTVVPPFNDGTRMLWAIERDIQVVCPALWCAEALLEAGAKVYVQTLWVPAGSGSEVFGLGTPSMHGADLYFRWPLLEQEGYPASVLGDSAPLVDAFQGYVAKFVHGEAPWADFEADDFSYLNLTLVPHMEEGFGGEACDWWKSYVARGEEEHKAFYALTR